MGGGAIADLQKILLWSFVIFRFLDRALKRRNNCNLKAAAAVDWVARHTVGMRIHDDISVSHLYRCPSVAVAL